MRTGFRPSIVEAFRDQCYDCTAFYVDGHRDCHINHCPLYVKHKYRTQQPNFQWVFGRGLNSIHDQRRRIQQLSKEEYIQKYVYENGIYKLGNTVIIKALCASCNNDYSNGKIDCEIDTCSLYFWMPYRDPTHIPNYQWLFHFIKHRQAALLNKCTKRVRMNGIITTVNDIDKYIRYLQSKQLYNSQSTQPVRRMRQAVKRIRYQLTEQEK